MKAFWKCVSAFVLAFGVVIILVSVVGLVWIFRALLSAHVGANLDLASFISACATLLAGGATLVVVWIINYVYISKSSSHKADSDLLLEVVREVIASLGTLRESSLPCHSGKKLTMPERAKLIWAERDLSNAVHSFTRALQYCNITSNDCDASRLKDCRAELKDSLTDDPFPGPYPAPSQNRVSNAFRDMRDELTKLSFGIIHR